MPTKSKPAAKKAARTATPATASKAAPAKKKAAAPVKKKSMPAKPAKPAKTPAKPAKPAQPAKAPAKPAKAPAKAPAQPAKAPAKATKPAKAPAKAAKPAPAPAPKAAPPKPAAKTPAKKATPAAPAKKPTTSKTAGRPFPKPHPLPIARRTVVREEWTPDPEIPMATFVKKQKARLLELKDSLVDSVSGMANETLRARAEGSEASAFGMHQADAGSDAYDRDFALSLLSKEQDALYEIEEALKRIDQGTYGICEMSGEKIPQARLEARPFARFTVDCQAEYEREVSATGGRRSVRSLFGLMDSEDDDEEEEDGGKETVEKSDD
jgi:RNA polymerase-binding protein DksA